MNSAIDHILGRIGEPLRLADAAAAARLSPFHFHRVFQALMGETPADFVKRLRLEKALFMMAHGGRQSLTRIALACGFASSSDFCRSFRQRYGAAPSAFDLKGWRAAHGAELQAITTDCAGRLRVDRLPALQNPDAFRVRIRDLPARMVAYIRVRDPYAGDGVANAAARLIAWAERHGFADGQWLGYQWDNPEIVPLAQCQYHIAVQAQRFSVRGEIGRFSFPPMRIAEIEIRGGVELELRALQWLFGSWLPRSGYVPDDHPCFEAFVGRPFAHGPEYFELKAQLPVRRE